MLLDYLGEPYYQIGIGNIYPIKVREFPRFLQLSNKYLIIGKETIKNQFKQEIDYLLDFYLIQEEDKSFSDLIELFQLTLHEKVNFIIKDNNDYAFRVENSSFEINKYNYETFREIVMKQNLQFEPYTFEDGFLEEWLEEAREARAKNGAKVDLESMCQLICIYKGLNPREILDYTYYQIVAEYARIGLKDSQEFIMLIRSQGGDVPLPNVAEIIDITSHPDEALIKKENSKSID